MADLDLLRGSMSLLCSLCPCRALQLFVGVERSLIRHPELCCGEPVGPNQSKEVQDLVSRAVSVETLVFFHTLRDTHGELYDEWKLQLEKFIARAEAHCTADPEQWSHWRIPGVDAPFCPGDFALVKRMLSPNRSDFMCWPMLARMLDLAEARIRRNGVHLDGNMLCHSLAGLVRANEINTQDDEAASHLMKSPTPSTSPRAAAATSARASDLWDQALDAQRSSALEVMVSTELQDVAVHAGPSLFSPTSELTARIQGMVVQSPLHSNNSQTATKSPESDTV